MSKEIRKGSDGRSYLVDEKGRLAGRPASPSAMSPDAAAALAAAKARHPSNWGKNQSITETVSATESYDKFSEVTAKLDGGVPIHSLDPEFAYGQTQTDSNIRDGDVLLVNNSDGSKTLGIMMDAWPVAVAGEPGALHKLKPEYEAQMREQYPTAFATIDALNPEG